MKDKIQSQLGTEGTPNEPKPGPFVPDPASKPYEAKPAGFFVPKNKGPVLPQGSPYIQLKPSEIKFVPASELKKIAVAMVALVIFVPVLANLIHLSDRLNYARDKANTLVVSTENMVNQKVQDYLRGQLTAFGIGKKEAGANAGGNSKPVLDAAPAPEQRILVLHGSPANQSVGQVLGNSVSNISNEQVLDVLRSILAEGLPEDIKLGLKGDKGDPGPVPAYIPNSGQVIGTTLPSAPSWEQGSISSATYLSAQNFVTEKLIVNHDANLNGSVVLTDDLTVSGNTNFSSDLTSIGTLTSSGQFIAAKIPTLPHVFTPWPAGTSNASDSSVYINPASAAADSNLLSAAVGGSVKFLVDAEGDIYGNNLILAGSTTAGPINSDLIPLTDNTYNIGSATKGWKSLTLSTPGTINFGAGRFIHISGTDNTFIGLSSGNLTTTGDNNLAVGNRNLTVNTTGRYNTAIGNDALSANSTGGDYNTAVGGLALNANTSGNQNVALGLQALRSNTIGTRNTAVGGLALDANISGDINTVVGYQAAVVSTSSQNTAVGYRALFNQLGGANNSAFGLGAGLTNTTGSNNTFLGINADASSNNLTNATAIGSNAIVGASNAFILGGTGANAVNVGIGTTSPSAVLHVKGATTQVGRFELNSPPSGLISLIDGVFTTNPGFGTRLFTIQANADGGTAGMAFGQASAYTNLGTSDFFQIWSRNGKKFSINTAGSITTAVGNSSVANDAAAFFGISFIGATSIQHTIITQGTYTTTSAKNGFAGIKIGDTINQTTDASSTYGVLVSPTLTAAADYRGIQIDSAGAFGVYQSSATPKNYFAGNVGIGTAAPASLLHVATSTTATGLTLFEQASGDADSYDLNFRKARGTVASPSVITTADELGVINFRGYSGASGYVTGAAIKGISSDTIADTRIPGLLSFWTSTSATPSVLTERMRIDNAGFVGIGTTNPVQNFVVSAPGSVANFEVFVSSGIGVQSFNRTTGLYGSFTFDGLTVNYRTSGTSGSLSKYSSTGAKTLAGATVGMEIDLNTNITPASQSITGELITLPTVTAANTNTYKGYSVTQAALTSTGAGASNWIGLDVNMPAITQTAGTLTSTGLKITGGTVTSGTSYGLIVDATAGNTGIGETNPTTGKLVINQTDAVNLPGIYINTEESTDSQSVFSIETDSTVGSGADTLHFKITADGSVFSDANVFSTPADVAEMYYTQGNAQAGDVVELISTSSNDEGFAVIKATGNHTVMGIISTNPGPVMNYDWKNPAKLASQKPVALVGRVPVKVTEENGQIHAGDRLTVSQTLPGHAMKQILSGQSVGIALENSNSPTDTILVFVNLSYQHVDVTQSSNGNLTAADKDYDFNNHSLLGVKSIASMSGKWSIDDNGTIIAETVQAKRLCLEDICVNKDQLKILLQNAGLVSGSNTPSPTPAPTPIPDPTPAPGPAPTPNSGPEVTP